MNKKLYKSRDDKVFFGVCGGIAEYFDTDPVLIRLAFVLFALAGGSGIIFYIIAAIIMKEDVYPYAAAQQEAYSADDAEKWRETFAEEAGGAERPPSTGRVRGRGTGLIILGLLFIIFGALYIISRFIGIWIDYSMIFAAVLIILGVYFVARR
jgi:phage shock protein C